MGLRIADDGSRVTDYDKRFTVWATAVLLLAALLRLVALQGVPPGLAQDEVLDADIAAFIRGGYHAVFFREGYGHEPLYHYLAAPFAPLLGDNMLAIRLPSVFLGLLLVALTMRWAKREFGVVTAVAAGLGLAVSWWPIIFSRIGIRPILLPLLLLLAAWFWRRPLLAGLFLGFSFYSYTAARIIFLLPVGYALAQRLAGRRMVGGAAWWRWLLITLAIFMVMAAPMQVALWRDPTLQQRVEQLAGPLTALRQGDAGPVLGSALRTLGVFSFTGDPRWTYSLPGRPLFAGVTAVFFYVGLLAALWRWREGRMALLLVWLAVGLIPSALTPQAPSTVRLIAAMPVVYTLMGMGVAAGVAQSQRLANNYPAAARFIRLLMAALFTAVFVYNLARTVADGFVHWPQAQATRLEHYQSALLAMSRYIKAHPTDVLVVADGFYEPIDRDSLRRSLGYDPAARWVQTGAPVAGAVVLPAREMGENGRLVVPEFAPINPALLAAAGIAAEPLYRSSQWPSFAVYELPVITAVPPLDTPISFEEVMTLEGYEILPGEPGGVLRLITVWRVTDTLPADLTAFAHLLDIDGNLLAQHDGWDAAPAELQPGDTVVQLHTIPIPQADGPLTLQIGLYTPSQQRRLRHTGDLGDVVVLARDLFVDGK
ncbi:MAG: hypothetical protein IPM39_16435 [Chloroflexi bacterium]|nr:hypothetical protein [Chloroflexota bacterium]